MERRDLRMVWHISSMRAICGTFAESRPDVGHSEKRPIRIPLVKSPSHHLARSAQAGLVGSTFSLARRECHLRLNGYQ